VPPHARTDLEQIDPQSVIQAILRHFPGVTLDYRLFFRTEHYPPEPQAKEPNAFMSKQREESMEALPEKDPVPLDDKRCEQ